ncbi:hypothetical protein B0H13DRAFT_2293478 [Mycena leptocephala]|nr:hypothetical protein B0H13DRAFT_2293478 [Mycena leptocephala]
MDSCPRETSLARFYIGDVVREGGGSGQRKRREENARAPRGNVRKERRALSAAMPSDVLVPQHPQAHQDSLNGAAREHTQARLDAICAALSAGARVGYCEEERGMLMDPAGTLNKRCRRTGETEVLKPGICLRSDLGRMSTATGSRRVIDRLPHPFLSSNASRFLDHEWVDLLALEAFLEKAATGDLNASTRTDLSPADRRLRILFRSGRRLLSGIMDFLCSTPNHNSSTPSNPIHVKPETNPPSVPPPPACSVKGEPVSVAIPPSIKMRTTNHGGHEIIELLSDSESDGAESDFEVTDVLMQGASRSSSPIPQRPLGEIDSEDEAAIRRVRCNRILMHYGWSICLINFMQMYYFSGY